jgi:hypothetical protein
MPIWAIATTPEGPKVCRLPAGGKRIRTCGPAVGSVRSETSGIDPRSFGPLGRQRFRRGTNGSNPACSSGESRANLTGPRWHHHTDVIMDGLKTKRIYWGTEGASWVRDEVLHCRGIPGRVKSRWSSAAPVNDGSGPASTAPRSCAASDSSSRPEHDRL